MVVFKVLWVMEVFYGVYEMQVVECDIGDLLVGDVLICVQYFLLNYKDVLFVSGNCGVICKYLYIFGIDVVGVVVEFLVVEFVVGDEVIVIGYDLGMNIVGGFGQYICVFVVWVIKCL